MPPIKLFYLLKKIIFIIRCETGYILSILNLVLQHLMCTVYGKVWSRFCLPPFRLDSLGGLLDLVTWHHLHATPYRETRQLKRCASRFPSRNAFKWDKMSNRIYL